MGSMVEMGVGAGMGVFAASIKLHEKDSTSPAITGIILRSFIFPPLYPY
jgi:hypothetical protein